MMCLLKLWNFAAEQKCNCTTAHFTLPVQDTSKFDACWTAEVQAEMQKRGGSYKQLHGLRKRGAIAPFAHKKSMMFRERLGKDNGYFDFFTGRIIEEPRPRNYFKFT